MKKYCPFCESELSETLWCEHCKRYVILYNTYNADAGRNADEHKEAEPKEAPAMPYPDTAGGVPTAKKTAESDNPAIIQNTLGSSNITAPKSEKPKRDIAKLVVLGSMLFVCLVLCLAVCTYLVYRQNAEPTGEAYSAKGDVSGENNAKHTEKNANDAQGRDTNEDPGSSDKDIPGKDTNNDPGSSNKDIPDKDANEDPGSSDADTPDDDAEAEAAEKNTTNSASWKSLEALTPLDLQTYGGTKYYYYAAEDIEALGLQCTYYHLEIAYDQAEAEIINFFGQDASEDSPLDDTYFNTYVDSGSEYYTSFQKILSYDCGEIRCSVNYDTGSGTVHFISFTGTNIEDYAELILAISKLASPDHSLSLETLQENIQSVQSTLLSLDPPDMWHEEYVYQDSCISLSMTYTGDTYELQLTSKKYAEDVAMNTLSISRPKY